LIPVSVPATVSTSITPTTSTPTATTSSVPPGSAGQCGNDIHGSDNIIQCGSKNNGEGSTGNATSKAGLTPGGIAGIVISAAVAIIAGIGLRYTEIGRKYTKKSLEYAGEMLKLGKRKDRREQLKEEGRRNWQTV